MVPKLILKQRISPEANTTLHRHVQDGVNEMQRQKVVSKVIQETEVENS